MQEYYSFFLKCSKYCNKENKDVFEKLAFNKASSFYVILNNQLFTYSDTYDIPIEYTEKERIKVEKIIDNERESDYCKLQNQIKDYKIVWSNVRKKEKLRFIDKYILTENSKNKTLLFKNIIIIALILKLISNNDILFENGNIINIKVKFTKTYFDNINALDLPYIKNEQLKNIWFKYLKSIELTKDLHNEAHLSVSLDNLSDLDEVLTN